MNSPDLTMAMIKMVLSLAVILGVLWAIHRWMRKSLPAARLNARGRLIKVLASNHLGMKKSIALVQVPGSVLVLGVGTEQINLLKSIDDPDIIAGMQVGGESGGADSSFAGQLQRLTRNFRGGDKSGASLKGQGDAK